MGVLLSSGDIGRALKRISHEIIEHNQGITNLVLNIHTYAQRGPERPREARGDPLISVEFMPSCLWAPPVATHMHLHIHTYTHAYIHTFIHKYIHNCSQRHHCTHSCWV